MENVNIELGAKGCFESFEFCGETIFIVDKGNMQLKSSEKVFDFAITGDLAFYDGDLGIANMIGDAFTGDKEAIELLKILVGVCEEMCGG